MKLKETKKDIGHLQYPSNNIHPMVLKKNTFVTYNYGRYCVVYKIANNEWLVNFKNCNFNYGTIEKIEKDSIFILNHDMFGYPACTVFSIQIVPGDDIIIKKVRYTDTHHFKFY